MIYLGHLSHNDPLHGYLNHEIMPQMGIHGANADFRVFGLQASNHVYLYEDSRSGVRVVGKFYGGICDRSPESACRRMEREYQNLSYLRGLGFNGYPHYIARPLGRNTGIDCILVQEFCWGIPLTDFIVKAITEGRREALFDKLTSLAWFLATLHNRTATEDRVDFNHDCAYFDRIVDQLRNYGYMKSDEAGALFRLKDQWRERGHMWEDNQVLVHGDVTPTNVLFGDERWVVAIDLERMKRADRVFDVGRVAAEIKHFFMQYTGSGRQAEPFIGHFLWEYACHFPDAHSAFASITRRLPFHMGLTLLRISRNSWISGDYRRRLINAAKKTLR
ncbi:MAG: aminoglycoside phosphotransferase family protein [Nitrospirota bacterium]|nr:aminoglycoside phosphotransferase family protein [Nitrospirota bacterium]